MREAMLLAFFFAHERAWFSLVIIIVRIVPCCAGANEMKVIGRPLFLDVKNVHMHATRPAGEKKPEPRYLPVHAPLCPYVRAQGGFYVQSSTFSGTEQYLVRFKDCNVPAY